MEDKNKFGARKAKERRNHCFIKFIRLKWFSLVSRITEENPPQVTEEDQGKSEKRKIRIKSEVPKSRVEPTGRDSSNRSRATQGCKKK